ncbi:hypothetical protein [Bradyrhizobium sp. LMG 9283]|uniref:hypothetical protein n=1 Tax=Bradyrhizobium sp. LMG 9283 TaxID=592064 RepID=UPI00388EF136
MNKDALAASTRQRTQRSEQSAAPKSALLSRQLVGEALRQARGKPVPSKPGSENLQMMLEL